MPYLCIIFVLKVIKINNYLIKFIKFLLQIKKILFKHDIQIVYQKLQLAVILIKDIS